MADSDIADLRERLLKARWSSESAGGDNQYSWMRSLVEYWTTAYNWRRREERLNRYPQFTPTVGGTNNETLLTHVTAHQAPRLLVDDIRTFFGGLSR